MFWLQIAILLCLVLIFCQDLLYRAVYWFCFPVLGILLMAMKYRSTNMASIFLDAGYATLFLMVQLFILWIYFSIKTQRLVHITRHYLGWGDILFLLAVTFYLSPVNYIVFYVLSLLLVLLHAIITNVFNHKINKHIPLAGLQALLLAVLFLMEMYTHKIKLYDDSWIYI